MRAIILAELADDLPTREAMRDRHKSRHHEARFTTRTRRPYVAELGR